MSYKILKESSIEKLEKLTNSYLEKGYECAGGVIFTDGNFCQSVKKKRKSSSYHSSHVPFGMDF